jgi:hypothetical protein
MIPVFVSFVFYVPVGRNAAFCLITPQVQSYLRLVSKEVPKTHNSMIYAEWFWTEQENNGKLLERRNAALEERYVVQTAMASMAHVASSRSVRAPEDVA